MTKASDNDYPSVLFTEQAAKPSAPAAGKRRLYFKTDNKFYNEDEGGTETEIGSGTTPASHAASHQNGGGDEISVAGLSGALADGQTPLDHDHTGDAGDGGLFNFRINPSLADLAVSGPIEVRTAAENLVHGDFVYVNASSKMAKADASALATAMVVGMAIATISADATGQFLMFWGKARKDAWAWTPGANLYLSETAGALTETAPTTTDSVTLIVAQADTADIILFCPSRTPVVHT